MHTKSSDIATKQKQPDWKVWGQAKKQPECKKVQAHRCLFSNPVKPCWYTIGPVEPLRGINKYAWDAKLLPLTALAYPVHCVCFCHLYWRHSTTYNTAFVSVEGIGHL